nr:hypothetical protein [Tanacetum cinerariifolium]
RPFSVPWIANLAICDWEGGERCGVLYEVVGDLMMMVLVRQTKECDMMLHMEKTDILILVAEIKVGDMIVDDVDKLACSTDVVKPRKVDLKFAHASI